jgi:hypothetical protein
MEYKNIKSKETYSEEEKKAIMEMLNRERKEKEQKSSKPLPKIDFSHIDKSKILQKLNRERKEQELFEKMAKQRIANKKIYSFHNKLFYKIKNLERDYYLKCEDYQKLRSRPRIITIYHEFLGEMKKKDVLIQIRRYSDKIYISDDLIKVYYKSCYLEDDK